MGTQLLPSAYVAVQHIRANQGKNTDTVA